MISRHVPDQFGEVALLRFLAVDGEPDLAFEGWPIFEAGCTAEHGAE